jgi:hypothetical protein
MAQSGEMPVSYMNRIFTAFDQTKTDTWQYLKAVTKGKSASGIENKRRDLLKEILKAKLEVQKIGNYHGDDSLKSAVVDYLDLSYSVLKEDFDKILDMEEIAEQSYDLMEAYLLAKEKANEKLNDSYENVAQAQRNFANKHNITLVEAETTKISEKIEKASSTLKYYNELYLIFFKSYKQEAYVLDAMDRNDVSAFEQNIGTLSLYSNEGLEKLNVFENYLGDPNLKTYAKKALTFYKTEAEKDFPSLTDYFIKKDSFEKIKKAFESISESKRTQQDIDQFNEAVNEFNEVAQNANMVLKAGNTKRQKMLNEWNTAVNNFFEKHAD